MPEHKLISLCLETSDRIVVNVTLLKEASHYKMRTERVSIKKIRIEKTGSFPGILLQFKK